MKTELGIECRRLQQGLVSAQNHPDNSCVRPEKYGGKVDFYDYVPLGARLLIPSSNLFGTQRMDEYDLRKRKKVETNLTRCGVNCLYEHPVPVCILPKEDISTLVIIDGHHRTRYAGKFRVNPIPCIVFTPSQLIDIFNRHGVYKLPIDETSFITDLEGAVRETLSSFAVSLPEHKHPRTIPVSGIDGLKTMFQSF